MSVFWKPVRKTLPESRRPELMFARAATATIGAGACACQGRGGRSRVGSTSRMALMTATVLPSLNPSILR